MKKQLKKKYINKKKKTSIQKKKNMKKIQKIIKQKLLFKYIKLFHFFIIKPLYFYFNQFYERIKYKEMKI